MLRDTFQKFLHFEPPYKPDHDNMQPKTTALPGPCQEQIKVLLINRASNNGWQKVAGHEERGSQDHEPTEFTLSGSKSLKVKPGDPINGK